MNSTFFDIKVVIHIFTIILYVFVLFFVNLFNTLVPRCLKNLAQRRFYFVRKAKLYYAQLYPDCTLGNEQYVLD